MDLPLDDITLFDGVRPRFSIGETVVLFGVTFCGIYLVFWLERSLNRLLGYYNNSKAVRDPSTQ